jgi:hypothetical protein
LKFRSDGFAPEKWRQNWKEYCNKACHPTVKEKNAWEARAIDKSEDLENLAIMIIVTAQLAEKTSPPAIPSEARNLSALNAEKKRDSSSLRSSE